MINQDIMLLVLFKQLGTDNFNIGHHNLNIINISVSRGTTHNVSRETLKKEGIICFIVMIELGPIMQYGILL